MPNKQPPTDPRQERDFESLLEDAEVKDFLHRFQTLALPNIKRSGMILGIVASEPDAKLCLEMGAALLFDKPIVLLVLKGRKVSRNLQRVAAEIIAVDDITSPEAQQRLQAAIEKHAESD